MYSDARNTFSKEQGESIASQQKSMAKSDCHKTNQKGLREIEMLRLAQHDKVSEGANGVVIQS
ncbi:MAG: hypothetical protein WHS63_00655 [Tenuifilum sp.]|uniref:hypothetical protein n=1 Tax=Tenuifilum sp. TaxID=2760880 RepID=UPI0030A81142